MSTIFKKIIDKEINADIVYEDKNILAFKDVNPVSPIHILIIPKKEIPTINNISSDDKEILGEMLIVAKKIAEKLNVNKNGYRLVFNCNEDGGQTVFHIHMHLLAGRSFSWPPG
tara:strand:+ start:255 stop:596 length:342 start_codon:yes stop_codon:yes gene_type:complete